MIKKTRFQMGQALIEWAVFSLVIFGLWISSMEMAQRFLGQTVVESWSMLGARLGLSGTTPRLPQGLRLETMERRDRKALVRAGFRGSEASASLEVPGARLVSSPSSSFSFGYLYSLFLE